MSCMPRYSRFRPDFMAPGPHVTIEKREVVFSGEPAPDFVDDDSDGEVSSYRYYPSTKILGKLYRAIDEQEVFREIQQYSKTGGTIESQVMAAAWSYVQRICMIIQWEHLKPWARDIRDM